MNPWRMVRLVVVNAEGEPLGITAERRVEMPWWQEAAPIAAAFPGAVVLRMLTVEPEPGERAGGRLVYAAEVSSPPAGLSTDLATDLGAGPDVKLAPVPAALRDALADHPLRMPWARPGGPAADLAWMASHAPLTGRPTQHRTWNLSAIWSAPTADGRVWLKCVAPFFAHEGTVLRALADQAVPQVVAAEGHRLLLAELPGADGYDATAAERRGVIDALVEIQLAAADRVDTLVESGVPDRRWDFFSRELSSLVSRRAPGNAALERLVASLPDRFAEIDACGLPWTLAHGDAHAGNARIGVPRPVWFDWGDSYVGNPLMDLDSHGDGQAEHHVHWLDRWADAVPGSDPHRAWKLLRPVAQLRMAWVYQSFLDHIEPSEHPYHADDVAPALARATSLM